LEIKTKSNKLVERVTKTEKEEDIGSALTTNFSLKCLLKGGMSVFGGGAGGGGGGGGGGRDATEAG
jgi:hypothetical protein